MSLSKKTIRILLFGLMLGVVLLVLNVLNWLPSAFDPSGLRRYGTVAELRAGTGMRDLRLPAYVPEYLEWPPSEILGQGKPYKMSLLHFRDSATGLVVVAVRQVEADVSDPAPPRIRPAGSEPKETFKAGGISSVQRAGDCGDGRSCSWVSWTEDDWSFLVVTTAPTSELRRIVQSMSAP